MSVSEKFYIKVNENDVYDSNGIFKSLKELHTLNSILCPENNLDNYIHPVLNSIGENPNAYRQIYSTDTSKFVNNDENIDLKFDTLSDAITPVVSERLYKDGTNYPIMHPYMVEILDYFSKDRTKTSLAGGTYSLNRYGNSTLKNVGIIELQGGGGGSGGANYEGADAAGGGGGGGGFAAIYYRIKNTSANIDIKVSVGSGGSAGGSGSGDGGAGGTSSIQFILPDGTTYTVNANGGRGGQTGDRSYNSGGGGGSVTFGSTTLASGGSGGWSDGSPSSGGLTTATKVLVDNSYLFVVLLAAQGGAGGGRGDDTAGTGQGQAGSGSHTLSYTFPKSNNYAKTVSYSWRSGGSKGENVTDAIAGGGGASTLANGANGGAKSSSGNSGSLGSGAGGAGVGNNSNRAGSRGGSGVIYYYK